LAVTASLAGYCRVDGDPLPALCATFNNSGKLMTENKGFY
jgi:hypothetical protein